MFIVQQQLILFLIQKTNHKNLDRTDNRVENLEWITSSDNQKHKYQNGDYKTSNRKIGQFDLDGNFIQEFESIIAAARAIGRNRQGIDRVVHGRSSYSYGFIWKFLD